MAQKTVITLEDDMDGGPADETITFALDGQTYEIDLSQKNADKFRGFIWDYTANARKVGRKTGTAGAKSTKTNAKEVRDWAKSNGFDVPDRGRIPAEVQKAFDAR